MKKLLPLLLFILMPAWSAQQNVVLPDVIIDRADYGSLQRGAAAFSNYCSGCHSLQYLRYGHVSEDLGISEEILKKTIMPSGKGLNDYFITAMSTADATEWFHQAAPPDLSLSARLRGKKWLYAYLKGFYRDDERPSGWNNTIFPDVAMPHALANLQGIIEKDEDGSERIIKEGKMSPVEYKNFLNDLVNFMDYAADPNRPERHRLGYLTLIVLLVLLIVSFFVYRDYWRHIH